MLMKFDVYVKTVKIKGKKGHKNLDLHHCMLRSTMKEIQEKCCTWIKVQV